MSTTTAPTSGFVRAARRGRRARQVLAFVLLGGWAWVLAATALTGQREASWDTLTEALEAGQVDHVTVVGSLGSTRGDVTGSSRAEVHWRDHLMMRRTEVEERVGSGAERLSDDVHVVREPVADVLRTLDPDLRITRDDYRSGASMPVLGLTLSGPPATAAFLLSIATLMLLVGGPEPERATRWAWFWLFTACPVLACPAYLVLGGLVRAHPAPRAGRLTGGWAFLVSLLLGGAGAASR